MSDSTTPEPVQYLLDKIAHLSADDQRELAAGWAKFATPEQRRRLAAAGLLEEAAGDDDWQSPVRTDDVTTVASQPIVQD